MCPQTSGQVELPVNHVFMWYAPRLFTISVFRWSWAVGPTVLPSRKTHVASTCSQRVIHPSQLEHFPSVVNQRACPDALEVTVNQPKTVAGNDL